MTQDEAFLTAIAEDPDDDALRLIYADWLEDHGDPERAKFIRVQIETFRDRERTTAEQAQLRQRERELLERNRERWLQPVFDAGAKSQLHGEFMRGFVAYLYMDAEAFIERGEELCRITPVSEVRLEKIGRHAKKLSRCEHLSRLRGISLDGTGAQLRTVLGSPYLAGLRSLSLSGKLTDDDLRGLASLPNLPRLDRLYLSTKKMTGVALPGLVARFGPLESLTLEYCPRFEGARLAAVLEALNATRLRSLGFITTPLRAAGMRTLADARNLAGLTDLEIQGCSLDREAIEALAGSRHLTPLETLFLTWSALPASALTALASWPGLRTVRKLNLDDADFGPAGAEALARSPYLESLEKLELRDCHLGDAGVAALASCPALAGLRELDLDHNGITDVGAGTLAAVPFSGLRRLNIDYNAIGDVGANALAASPHLRSLRWLTVGDPVSEDAARQLALNFPHLSFLIAAGCWWPDAIEAVRAGRAPHAN